MKKIKIQTGRSMVEMLGVLAIIGVLSIGGIAGYSMAMEKYRINQALDAIQLVVQEVHVMYASEEYYDGMNDGSSDGSYGQENSIAMNILKKIAINTYYPLWLGEVGFLEEGVYVSGFFVRVSNLSQNGCVSLGTQKYEGTNKIFNSISDARTKCKNNNKNYIELQYKKDVLVGIYIGNDNGNSG